MDKDETRSTGGGADRGEEMSEAEIDKNLNGSFPASDPPSWTLGTDHREEGSAEDKSTGSSREE